MLVRRREGPWFGVGVWVNAEVWECCWAGWFGLVETGVWARVGGRENEEETEVNQRSSSSSKSRDCLPFEPPPSGLLLLRPL